MKDGDIRLIGIGMNQNKQLLPISASTVTEARHDYGTDCICTCVLFYKDVQTSAEIEAIPSYLVIIFSRGSGGKPTASCFCRTRMSVWAFARSSTYQSNQQKYIFNMI